MLNVSAAKVGAVHTFSVDAKIAVPSDGKKNESRSIHRWSIGDTRQRRYSIRLTHNLY